MTGTTIALLLGSVVFLQILILVVLARQLGGIGGWIDASGRDEIVDSKRTTDDTGTDQPTDDAGTDQPTDNAETDEPTALAKAQEGREFYTVEEVPPKRRGTILRLSPKRKDAVQSLIKAGMNANDLAFLQGKSFRVFLNKEKMDELEGSGFLPAIAERSTGEQGHYFLLTKDGDLGTITQVPNLTALTAGLTAWKLLAFVTATKFLSDIKDRLTNIERGVSEVRSWLQENRAGEILGNFAYLDSIMKEVESDTLDKEEIRAFNSEIESIERQCKQHLASLGFEAGRRSTLFRSLDLSKGDTIKARKEAEALIGSFRECARLSVAVLGIRLAATQVRFALSGYSDLLSSRLDDIQEEIATQKDEQRQFFDLVDRRVHHLQSGWEWFWGEFNREQQKKIRITLEQTANSLDAICTSFEAAATKTVKDLKMAKKSKGIDLHITLDGSGKIKKCYRSRSY